MDLLHADVLERQSPNILSHLVHFAPEEFTKFGLLVLRMLRFSLRLVGEKMIEHRTHNDTGDGNRPGCHTAFW